MSSTRERGVLWPAVFEIDGFDGIFFGWTAGETWNGFACPRFRTVEADLVLEAAKESSTPEHAWYDPAKDAYFFVQEDIPSYEIDRRNPPPETHIFAGYDIQGMRVYAIGAWAWTWHQVGKDNPT